MAVITAAKLTPDCNITLLKEQLLSLIDKDWLMHVNHKIYQGRWDVLPLRCQAENISAHPVLKAFAVQGAGPYANIDIAESCSELIALFDSFQTEVLSARLMRLAPGAQIHPHCDDKLSIEFHQARLHIPLKNNSGVTFTINESVIPMQEGELWYINAHQLHAVHNQGTEERINLVIDCHANDWLKQQIEAAKNCI